MSFYELHFQPFFILVKMKNWLQWTWFLALLAFPIVLWALPASFFDDTGVTLCFSKWLFNAECMGCGMTRAVMHFHHFEFGKAWGFNRGVVVIYPALAVLWVYWAKLVAARLLPQTQIKFKGNSKNS